MKKVRSILFLFISFFTGFIMSRHLAFKRIISETNTISKYICLFKFANEWIKLKQNRIDSIKYFKDRNYYSIAIYGMGDLGERLADEIKNTDISVKYAIDRSRRGKYENIDIKSFDDVFPTVDAVVVTAIYNFCEIQRDLKEKFECPVISLEEILLDL